MKKFKQWIIRETFKRLYKFFEYPFESADERLSKLETSDREQYLYDVRTFIKSKAFVSEITELKREAYRELCEKTTSEEGVAGYRLCLMFLKKLEMRFAFLADLKNREEQVNKLKKM